MTLHCSFFIGRGNARGTHNNFLANYEIVIRLHGAHTNIVTLRKTRSQLCTGPVRKDARPSRKALPPCGMCVGEQWAKIDTRASMRNYARVVIASWVTERRAFENSSDRYKHAVEIQIIIWKMYFPSIPSTHEPVRAASPCNRITVIFVFC